MANSGLVLGEGGEIARTKSKTRAPENCEIDLLMIQTHVETSATHEPHSDVLCYRDKLTSRFNGQSRYSLAKTRLSQ